MKNRILFLFTFIVLSTTICFSQSNENKLTLGSKGFISSIDSNKNFIVVDFPGKKKNEIYTSALVYLNSRYKNPQKVLTIVENESIIINGYTSSFVGDLDWYKYHVSYRINLQFKDGKMRFESIINNIEEEWSDNKLRKVYISSLDSPNPAEINCIWVVSKNGANILLKKELKSSADKWINDYVNDLIKGFKSQDW